MNGVANRIEGTSGVEVGLAEYVADQPLSGSIKSTNLDVSEEALEVILETDIVPKNKQLSIEID